MFFDRRHRKNPLTGPGLSQPRHAEVQSMQTVVQYDTVHSLGHTRYLPCTRRSGSIHHGLLDRFCLLSRYQEPRTELGAVALQATLHALLRSAISGHLLNLNFTHACLAGNWRRGVLSPFQSQQQPIYTNCQVVGQVRTVWVPLPWTVEWRERERDARRDSISHERLD